VNAARALIERYFPCSFEGGHSLLVIIGALSALVYVFTRIGLHDQVRDLPVQVRDLPVQVRDLPLNLMWLTFLISAWGQRQQLKSDRVIHLLILAILIPWILFGISALIDYESAVKYRSANDLLRLFLSCPWPGGSAAPTKAHGEC